MNFTIKNGQITGDLAYGSLPVSTDDKMGYRPYELFVSSLIGCSGTILNNILKKKRYPFEKIEMTGTSVRNPDQANRIEQLSFQATIYSQQNLDEQQAEKIAHLVVKNCGMIQSVIQTIDLSFKINSVPLKN